MSVNRGVAPFDPDSEVGQVRVLVGDTVWEEYDPDEPGYGIYEKYSDVELEVFLSQGESVEGAVYFAYLQMAGSAAEEAKNVQDYDLKVDLTKRADALRRIAEMWGAKADMLAGDIFLSVDTVIEKPYPGKPELAPYAWRI